MPGPPDDPPAPDRDKPNWGQRFFGLVTPRASTADDDERREKFAVAGAGLELAAAIGLFAGLGYLLDWWLNTLPWFTVIGSLLGLAAGMYQLLKTVNRLNK
jgi:F0F1-type ATP synthase assembly protein I